MTDTPQQQIARRAELTLALQGFKAPKPGHVCPVCNPPQRRHARPVTYKVTAPCPRCDPYIPSRIHAGLAPEAD